LNVITFRFVHQRFDKAPSKKKESKRVKSGDRGGHILDEALPVRLTVFAEVFPHRIRKMRWCPISFEKHQYPTLPPSLSCAS